LEWSSQDAPQREVVDVELSFSGVPVQLVGIKEATIVETLLDDNLPWRVLEQHAEDEGLAVRGVETWNEKQLVTDVQWLAWYVEW
jgi:hypothetical protein